MMRDFRLPLPCKWDLRFSGILRRVDRYPRCVKSEKSADQHVKMLLLSILPPRISCDIALRDLRYAQLYVFRLFVFWVILPYKLIGRYRYHELNEDCQPSRTIRFKILSAFPNPMTITSLLQILNMASYLVLSGDVGLKPLNPDDTDEGK